MPSKNIIIYIYTLLCRHKSSWSSSTRGTTFRCCSSMMLRKLMCLKLGIKKIPNFTGSSMCQIIRVYRSLFLAMNCIGSLKGAKIITSLLLKTWDLCSSGGQWEMTIRGQSNIKSNYKRLLLTAGRGYNLRKKHETSRMKIYKNSKQQKIK